MDAESSFVRDGGTGATEGFCPTAGRDWQFKLSFVQAMDFS